MSEKENKNTRDFVDYNPEPIKFVTNEIYEIAAKHNMITSALREQIMTVKEIHDLYLQNDGTHSVTQQTVYRYLEELETADLITVAGFRKTEGIKASERIYGRTARIFFLIPGTAGYISDEMTLEEEEFIFKMGKILGITLGLDYTKLKKDDFVNFFNKFVSGRNKIMETLYKKISENEKIISIFNEMTLEQMNETIWYSQIFGTFIENPDLLSEIKPMFD